MGTDGLRQVAEVSYRRAHALAQRLSALPGWEMAFPDRHFFNEFPIRAPKSASIHKKLARRGILGALDVHRWFRDLKGVVTFACTEVNDARAIDELVEALGK